MRTRVFEELARRGWSHKEFARRSGLSVSYVGRVARGERPIGIAFLQGAKRAFPELALDYLFPTDEPAALPA